MPPRLHVAVLDEELPFPLTSGKRIRTLNLLARLAGRHDITYLCHRNANSDEGRVATAALIERGITPRPVERAVPAKSGPGFYGRLGANLFSHLPFSVATHTSRDLVAAVRRLHAERPVDLWHCEWTPYAEALSRAFHEVPSPWLVVAHNVESMIWRRLTESESNPLKRWYIARQWRKFEAFERRVYAAAPRTIAVSPEDAALIRTDYHGRSVEVVDNGVDTTFFSPHTLPAVQRDPRRVLFLGSLDWRPNLDAARLLLDEIMPAVRSSEPAATLSLVGRKPPAWLRERCAQTDGVELFADVPDVRPHLAACAVTAVPLRVGGGSRLKILEALAAGVPVVSTRVGAEGLNLRDGEHLTTVDGIEPMADALLQTIRQPDDARGLAERGRERVLEMYDWDRLADRLEQVWLATAGRGRGTPSPIPVRPAAV